MKNLLLLFFLISSSLFLNAQQDAYLPGVVVEQNSKFNTGKVNYLSKAQIKSSGSNPQFSDNQGEFTLVFADKPKGNLARINASKSGFETVNVEELKRAAVLGRKTPLKVVMCSEGQLAENQIAYYHIAQKSVLASYENQVHILSKAGKEKDRLIQKLEIEFNQDIQTVTQANKLLLSQLQKAQEQAKHLADKWLTVNLDDESQTYQKAFKAFIEEDIDEALRILNTVNLEQRLASNTAAIEKNEALVSEIEESVLRRNVEIKQDVNQCILQARLYDIKQDYEQAEKAYLLAYAYDAGNPDLVFEIAAFFHKNNAFVKCEKYYQNVLSIFKELDRNDSDAYAFEKAIVLNNYGLLLSARSKQNEAIEVLEDALSLLNKVMEKENEKHNELLASLNTSLGSVFFHLNSDKSKRFTKKALSIRRELAKTNPELHRIGLARALNNYASAIRDQNLIEAERYYQEGLRLLEKAAEKDANKYSPEITAVLNNLGDIYNDQNNFSKAKEYFEKAKFNLLKLVQQNRSVYLPDLASTTRRFGNALHENNDYIEASKKLEMSFSLYRELAEAYPDIYQDEFANICNMTGILLRAMGEINDAKKKYNIAFPIYKKLADENPTRYLSQFAMILNNLGQIHNDNNEFDEAEQYYKETIEIHQKLVAQDSTQYLPNLAIAYNNLGLVYKNKKEFDLAKSMYNESIIVNRQLVNRQPNLYITQLLMSLTNLSNLLYFEENYDEALILSKEVITISRKLYSINRVRYTPDMIKGLVTISLVLWAQNNLGEAQLNLEEALTLCDELSKDAPQLSRKYFCHISINLGAVYWNSLSQSYSTDIKEKGLKLLEEAKKKLLLLDQNNPQVPMYSERINMLYDLFAN